jgi:hypothetical protein
LGGKGVDMKNKILSLVVQFVLVSVALAIEAPTLTVSDKGLGSISATTAFNLSEVEKLVPGFVVKSKKSMTETEEFPILVVMDHDSLLATINPTEDRKKIFNIRITGNKVSNALGPKIGTRYASIYGASVNPSCSAGQEEMSGAVICPDPKSKHVSYVFKGHYDGPDGEVPAVAALKNFVVSEIVWQP